LSGHAFQFLLQLEEGAATTDIYIRVARKYSALFGCYMRVSDWLAAGTSYWPLKGSSEFFLRPTDSRPVCLGIGPPFVTLDQILSCSSFFVSQLLYSFSYGILSDEKTGLLFTVPTLTGQAINDQ
jgi:hypothetical protein